MIKPPKTTSRMAHQRGSSSHAELGTEILTDRKKSEAANKPDEILINEISEVPKILITGI